MSYKFADSLRTGSGRNWFGSPVWHVLLLCVQWKAPNDGRPDPARKLYDIYHFLCIQWKTPDDVQRNCPKHVEFYSKNKFEQLVHLVGFIMRIYHDARSPERQDALNRKPFLYNVSNDWLHLCPRHESCAAVKYRRHESSDSCWDSLK